MKIALDFDDTYTRAPSFWDKFITMAKDHAYDIRIVTFRKSTMTDPALDWIAVEKRIPIIFTEYIGKRAYCRYIGWEPDIWIDDSPEFIVLPMQHELP